MPTIIGTLPQGSYPAGNFGPSNPVTLPAGATHIAAEVDTTNIPTTATWTVKGELSKDNGATWTSWGGAGGVGGAGVDRQGKPHPFAGFYVSLLGTAPADGTWKYRMGGSLSARSTTSGQVTAYP